MSNCSVLRAGETASMLLAQGTDRDNADAGYVAYSRFGDSRSADNSVAAGSGRSAKNRSVKSPVPKAVLPDKILQSFNTWAFKRAQPSDPGLMLQIISEATTLGGPIPFVLYWGKGPRCRLDAPDIECLDYLAAFAGRVHAAYEHGAAVKLIFTDTHAELNGHSQQSMHEYFAEVEASARQRGFASCWMSEFTRAPQAHAAGDLHDDVVPQDTLRRLSAAAGKWYRGDGNAEQGALNYYRMNMVERRAVELAFPGSIFVTFSGSEFRGLFPQRLPIFYMYSLRRGVSSKPWFLSSDATSRDVSARACIVAQYEKC